MSKKKIAVLFGGQSSEHVVSCVSAANVIDQINKEKYDLLLIGITEEGHWVKAESVEDIRSGAWRESSVEVVISPDATKKCALITENGVTREERIDVAFPVLHGLYGEDGTVQGLFELAKIPYVGCGVLASAVSMDKLYTKIIVDTLGIRQAKYVPVMRWEMEKDMDKSLTKKVVEGTGVRQARYYLALACDFACNPEGVVRTAAEQLGSFPVFVKPCSQGSSVGVAKANNILELAEGLTEAFKMDSKVLVEEFIDGHEVECAVLGNEHPQASTVGEIAPTQEFYTFDAKYKDESSRLYIPAHITGEQLETVRQDALRVYTALGCRGLSRVDFFVTHDGGEVVFNELNAIPGFTSISMYPKLFDYEGIRYPELLDRLISLALEEHHG